MAIPITRVVVLMMENHSFDRVLGWMKQHDPGIEGVDPDRPGINPDYPVTTDTVFQEQTRSRNIANDPGHDLHNVLRQIANGNQGFVSDFAQTYPQAGPDERKEIMGWYPYGYLPALHFLAYNFVVCDHWYSSLPGPTWPNRFFVHSGTSLGHVDMPEGVFNPAIHVYDQETLYDELDAAGTDWRIYHGDFPQSLLMVHQLDKLDHYRTFDHWAADVQAGDLPAYVFIEPAYFGTEENDQHPPQDIMRGDLLVAAVFNALQANQAVFEQTLLVVLYDEHGGFYDHVTPPATIPPDGNTKTYAFNQLGVRVPAILVSPWLAPGFISTAFDHTSVLRLASQLWPAVQPLGARTAQANSPLDSLTWLDAPRRAIPPAPTNQDPMAVMDLPSLTGQKQALFSFSQYLESQINDPAVRAALMARAHEAMGGAIAQGNLATARLNAYMAEKQAAPAAAAAPAP
ncbi:alkaline phosphatase family protein [Acidisphaera sp. S103]|uniref:alkaline phosphatase family protein n=1 Tax=Acidisphaera sp. S103 TaxID=1747223 RepID=UPI00131C1DF2|nr:alkaline phosphatase family protein [Acidisphaera sp. S103]